MRLDGRIQEESGTDGHARVPIAQSFQCRIDETVI
jgi:hypothetical protein